MRKVVVATAGAVFVGSVLVANWASQQFGLVHIGMGLAVSAGTFAAGVSLVARDAVFEGAGGKRQRGPAVAVVAGLILVGAVLSLSLSAPALALASGVAFLVGEGFDTAAYLVGERWGKAAAVAISGAVGAPADTVLFLWLAPFPLTWSAGIGQVLVKVCISLAAAGVLLLWGRRRVARSRQEVAA